MCHIDSSV